MSSLNDEGLQAIRECISYVIETEYTHWLESGEPEDHMYKTALKAEKALDGDEQ